MATAELSGWQNWRNWRPFEHLKGDLTGGLTAAVVALPLGENPPNFLKHFDFQD